MSNRIHKTFQQFNNVFNSGGLMQSYIVFRKSVYIFKTLIKLIKMFYPFS